MHHAILPFLDYRLAQWNSRCSQPVVSPSKFAVLMGSRALAASCVAGNSGNGNLDRKRARVCCVGRAAVTLKMLPGQSEGPKG